MIYNENSDVYNPKYKNMKKLNNNVDSSSNIYGRNDSSESSTRKVLQDFVDDKDDYLSEKLNRIGGKNNIDIEIKEQTGTGIGIGIGMDEDADDEKKVGGKKKRRDGPKNRKKRML